MYNEIMEKALQRIDLKRSLANLEHEIIDQITKEGMSDLISVNWRRLEQMARREQP